jgi:hypothetical protein
MAEAIFAGAALAMILGWIGHCVRSRDSFVLHFDRGGSRPDSNPD